MKNKPVQLTSLTKVPTGITGFDDITHGGIPSNRSTLIYGGPGCGKTVFAMQFLVSGILKFNEPGVFMSFEETTDKLMVNFSSMGFDVKQLCQEKKLALDFVQMDGSATVETGDFNLDGIFIRLENAIKSTHAKRVVIDSIGSLISGLENKRIVRDELLRFFTWLSEHHVTSIVTAEKGTKTSTREGIEEYISDCVLFLDHRISEQQSKRRLRIIKYRGSAHSSNEYPFSINENGINVLPISELKLDAVASNKRQATGVNDLDVMMEDKGYYCGSSILVSGSAGTGKSTLSAHLANEVCSKGEKCLYFAFEESVSQIIRNMRSIGIDLRQHCDSGKLIFISGRPSSYGLEEHLIKMQSSVGEFEPSAVIIDPISNFFSIGNDFEIKAMLTSMIDFLKKKNITAFLTSLSPASSHFETTTTSISSIMDTWIVVRDFEVLSDKKRLLYVIKSRGMAHSRAIEEMIISNTGIHLRKPDFDVKPSRHFSY